MCIDGGEWERERIFISATSKFLTARVRDVALFSLFLLCMGYY